MFVKLFLKDLFRKNVFICLPFKAEFKCCIHVCNTYNVKNKPILSYLNLLHIS